ncbi:MAG: helix-turn-helix domain-containing protein [Planctomycetaceae bacterium]|nr:helix-turn-helix domain-containing protein [Planctomycetaceae bacterium]
MRIDTSGTHSYHKSIMAKRKPKSVGMVETLRNAIRESGVSANKLAEATGVPGPTITRFLNGADLRISRAAKLCVALGLELVKKS